MMQTSWELKSLRKLSSLTQSLYSHGHAAKPYFEWQKLNTNSLLLEFLQEALYSLLQIKGSCSQWGESKKRKSTLVSPPTVLARVYLKGKFPDALA